MGAIVPILRSDRLPPWAERVLSFLVKKGLLVVNRRLAPFRGQIPIKELLRAGREIEPRVLEVFPAAYLHFPRSFCGHHDIPPGLLAVIEAIRRKEQTHADYRGIPYAAMLRWAEHPLKDGRTKPLGEIRHNKTLRLHPRAIERLAALAVRRGKSETAVIEELLLEA